MLVNVAIVIVTYKRQDLLRTLLQSVADLDQTPEWVIVVDNENSMETRQIVAGFDHTQYVPMEENTGGAGGFSKGVEVAYQKGSEWIWLMDDDVKVFPAALSRLEPWMSVGVDRNQRAVQIRRQNFDGSDFYWQYDFKNHLGIPNPVAPSGFDSGENFRPINTMCFEGGLFHRSLVEEVGLPDSRFFIYWDDTMYGYLASKHTQPILVNETLMQRTRPLDNIQIGKVRRLNSTSDMTRYYIMRNRGYMAQYFRLYGDYHPVTFALGTFLTLTKETIRLLLTKNRWKSFKILIQGMKDGKKLRKDKKWQPMPKLD